jgi:hypothetical protein
MDKYDTSALSRWYRSARQRTYAVSLSGAALILVASCPLKAPPLAVVRPTPLWPALLVRAALLGLPGLVSLIVSNGPASC